MPFGLKNTLAQFQLAVETILPSVKWRYALVYSDDVVIFSRSPEKHLQHVEFVLQLMQKAGMTSKIKKCVFFSDAIDYREHVVTLGRLHIATETTDSARRLKYPTIPSELRSFWDCAVSTADLA